MRQDVTYMIELQCSAGRNKTSTFQHIYTSTPRKEDDVRIKKKLWVACWNAHNEENFLHVGDKKKYCSHYGANVEEGSNVCSNVTHHEWSTFYGEKSQIQF